MRLLYSYIDGMVKHRFFFDILRTDREIVDFIFDGYNILANCYFVTTITHVIRVFY